MTCDLGLYFSPAVWDVRLFVIHVLCFPVYLLELKFEILLIFGVHFVEIEFRPEKISIDQVTQFNACYVKIFKIQCYALKVKLFQQTTSNFWVMF